MAQRNCLLFFMPKLDPLYGLVRHICVKMGYLKGDLPKAQGNALDL